MVDHSAYCTDCKGSTEAVFDHTSGDDICSECGLVLESHCIDETPEWRIFSDSNDDHDPNRVGNATDPLLTADLYTAISKPKQASSLMGLGHRLHNIIPDSHLHKAFASITDMGGRLNLIPSIIDRAKEIYSKAVPDGHRKPRNHDALLGACLYLGCNQEGFPRTVKEICSVANGASKKDIGRTKGYIVKQLAESKGTGRAVRARDIVKRFCSNVGIMNGRVLKAAEEAVIKLEDEVDIRRCPTSVAAAVVYIITQLEVQKKGLRFQDIAYATGVAQGTIKNTCRDLHLHLSKFIPAWFAKPDDLSTLCSALK